MNIKNNHFFSSIATAILCVGLTSCSSLEKRKPTWGEQQAVPHSVLASTSKNALDPAVEAQSATDQRPDNSFYLAGNDQLVRQPQGIAEARAVANGDIKLNFESADILEVVKVILGDMLNTTYFVDPKVQGTVSMQTSKPLSKDDLIPTLELLLRMNDAALVIEADNYRIVPLSRAITRVTVPQLGDSIQALPAGFSVRVVPLRYVAANEMAQILEPFISSGSNQILRTDIQRNLLILAASGSEMGRLLETIHVFDVDRMKGMSVAMFTPDFVDAKTLANELEQLLSDNELGLLPGLIRFIVIERLNALMVVTPRAEHLASVKSWVSRLDRDSGSAGNRLFIYRVQNGKATDLADILGSLFESDTKQEVLESTIAPGLEPANISSPTAKESTPSSPPIIIADTRKTLNKQGKGLNIENHGDVRIIADEPNNALLILANTTDYRQILTALKQLDISPMQVLVEVTIAEVSLSDDLQYGVEWFFNNKVGSSLTGVGTLDLGTAGIAGIAPGFSYALQSSGNTVNAVINVLATESNLSIISSPTLLVLNNQEASIQVGDEVPVATQQQQTTDATANILNSIEYRETGVQLTVKPRINSGGLVIMDVEQETSIVPSTNNADPLTPRIQTRKIKSTVAVNSGDTIILGGLIQDNHNRSESGLPGLHKIPFLGSLFGTNADNQDRTELLVLITPRAVSNRNSALQVTEEFRRKLHSLIPVDENPQNK